MKVIEFSATDYSNNDHDTRIKENGKFLLFSAALRAGVTDQ